MVFGPGSQEGMMFPCNRPRPHVLPSGRHPVYSEQHVRGHVLLCMLAYYVEWHLWRRLAPLPFEEQDGKAAHERRDSPVEKAQARESAQAKTDSKHPPRAPRGIASRRCWPISGRSRCTRGRCPTPRITRSRCSPGQRCCKKGLSTSSPSIQAGLLPVNWQVEGPLPA